MNLFDFIRNTFVKNEPVWNYYGTNIYTDPIVTPEQSAQFIREFFREIYDTAASNGNLP